MWFAALAKDLFIIFCIGSLLLVGLTLVLKSGVRAEGKATRRDVLKNASGLAVALASCLTFLLMAQLFSGARIGAAW